ncbi:MAG: hypothetical protein M3Q78_04435 [Acidobacteriota bacterium]|nr:hypothetical protein [Acidobacteriota bacterium]
MNDKTKTGLEILEAALLLGILGDVLLRQTPWGLNVFLWVTVLAAAMVALTLRRKKRTLERSNYRLAYCVGFLCSNVCLARFD